MATAETIWVFFGLIATGKSTVAENWASRHSFPYYNSDRVRKELAGISATSRRQESHQQGIYSRELTLKTYAALLDRAGKEISAGKSVVLDASYQERKERDLLKDMAARLDVRIIFVYCICSPDVVKKRLEQRSKDPEAVSDGRWDIYQIQQGRFEVPGELGDDILVTLSTDRPVEELLDQLEKSYEV